MDCGKKTAKQNVTKENIAKENITKENIAKENIAKENIAKENITTKENIAKENIAKENITKENIAKENITKEKKTVKHRKEELNIPLVATPCNFCTRTIGRCVVVSLPHGFVWTGETATVVASPDLSCCITECAARTNLCGVSFPSIELLEIKLTGIIQYVVNVPVRAESLSALCVGESTNISLSDSLKVNNVVCHLPADIEFECPRAICDVTAKVITSPPAEATRGDNTCGNLPFRAVGVNLLFTLPCICPPEFCPPQS